MAGASAPGGAGQRTEPAQLSPLAGPEPKPLSVKLQYGTQRSYPKDSRGTGGSLGANGLLALSPNLPGAASTTATAGGRAAATAG